MLEIGFLFFICIGLVILVGVAVVLYFIFRGNQNQNSGDSGNSGDSHTGGGFWGDSDSNDGDSGGDSGGDGGGDGGGGE